MIREALQNRGTAYESDSFDRIVSLADDAEMQQKWRCFLRNLHSAEIKFADVISGIAAFLQPVWNALLSKKEFRKSRSAKNRKWM